LGGGWGGGGGGGGILITRERFDNIAKWGRILLA
jgi:hypothetical protein